MSEADPGLALVRLLDERGDHYQGRTVADAEHLRGRLLGSFEQTGLPAEALPFVLEELEAGRNSSNVAAAGRALRGAATDLPPQPGELVVAAMRRLRANDEPFRYRSGCCEGPGQSALADLAATLAVLGPADPSARSAVLTLLDEHALEFAPSVRSELEAALAAMTSEQSCCHGAKEHAVLPKPEPGSVGALRAIELQDQDGVVRTFDERFAGRPSAISFFYTRCMNPEKCSLTITRMARLARRVQDRAIDVNVAAISYDPEYDQPTRLRTYGIDRGVTFSNHCMLLRTVGSFSPFAAALGLGVGFGPVTVNQHSLDLVVLDAELRVTVHHQRRLWSEDEVLVALVGARV